MNLNSFEKLHNPILRGLTLFSLKKSATLGEKSHKVYRWTEVDKQSPGCISTVGTEELPNLSCEFSHLGGSCRKENYILSHGLSNINALSAKSVGAQFTQKQIILK